MSRIVKNIVLVFNLVIVSVLVRDKFGVNLVEPVPYFYGGLTYGLFLIINSDW